MARFIAAARRDIGFPPATRVPWLAGRASCQCRRQIFPSKSFRDLLPRAFLGNLSAMKKKSSASKSAINTRPFSSILFDGDERAAARAMLYPVGFKEEDFKKPLIGVASTWSDVTPCNMHIDKLALESQKGVNASGGKAIIFNTITISDGISMGTEA
jgi:hypothetical protein